VGENRLQVSTRSSIDWRNVLLVLDECDELEDAKQYEKSFSLLSKAIRSVPTESRYRLRRGMLLCMNLGRFKKGFSDLHCAATFASESPHPQQALSLCYRWIGDIASAQKHAERAIELDKDDASSYYQLAACEFALKNFDAAIAQLEIALNIEPENELAWTELGHVLKACGKLDQAEAAFLKALAITQDASNYLNLAQVQLALGNKQGAVLSLKQAGKFKLDEVKQVLIDHYMAIAVKSTDRSKIECASLHARTGG
jgi:tetratricopeptide (TPR) repeat protein